MEDSILAKMKVRSKVKGCPQCGSAVYPHFLNNFINTENKTMPAIEPSAKPQEK